MRLIINLEYRKMLPKVSVINLVLPIYLIHEIQPFELQYLRKCETLTLLNNIIYNIRPYVEIRNITLFLNLK